MHLIVLQVSLTAKQGMERWLLVLAERYLVTTANTLRDLPHVRGSRYQKCAIIQHDNLQSYFMNTGTVEWQISHVTSCGPVMS